MSAPAPFRALRDRPSSFEDRSGQVAAGLGRAQNRPRQGPASSVSRVSKVRIKSARDLLKKLYPWPQIRRSV